MNARAYLFHSTITVELVVSLGRSLMNRLVAKLMQAAYFWWLQKCWKRYGKCLFWENQQEEQCFHGKTVKSRKSYKTSFNNSRNWSVAFCSFLVRLNNFHLTFIWNIISGKIFLLPKIARSVRFHCAQVARLLIIKYDLVDKNVHKSQNNGFLALDLDGAVFLPMNHILHGFCSE